MYCIERGAPWWRVLLCVLPFLSPPVVGMLTGKRRRRRGNPIFIFDAFTKVSPSPSPNPSPHPNPKQVVPVIAKSTRKRSTLLVRLRRWVVRPG